VVVRVVVVRPYGLVVEFDDGLVGLVDLAAKLSHPGPVFKPLQDPEYFARVRVDVESGTVVWPNEADIAPETLYEVAKAKPLHGLVSAAGI
jgi:hypothetical protein